ncbi:hypothetical protein GJ496_008164 [Pomphorhynchus laevis]|nr:hypothetical protein GJ496_008164 [Pomphorhynchus laevis]
MIAEIFNYFGTFIRFFQLENNSEYRKIKNRSEETRIESHIVGNENVRPKQLVSNSTQTSVSFDNRIKENKGPVKFPYSRSMILLELLENNPYISGNEFMDIQGIFKNHEKYNYQTRDFLNTVRLMYERRDENISKSSNSLILANSQFSVSKPIYKTKRSRTNDCASLMILRKREQRHCIRRTSNRNHKLRLYKYGNRISNIPFADSIDKIHISRIKHSNTVGDKQKEKMRKISSIRSSDQTFVKPECLEKRQHHSTTPFRKKLLLPDECDMVLNEEKYHRCPRGILHYSQNDDSLTSSTFATTDNREPTVWFMHTGIWVANLISMITRLVLGTA